VRRMFGSTAKNLYVNDAMSTIEGDANGNKEKNCRGQKARRKKKHC
jgi:hypothetical protein